MPKIRETSRPVLFFVDPLVLSILENIYILQAIDLRFDDMCKSIGNLSIILFQSVLTEVIRKLLQSILLCPISRYHIFILDYWFGVRID